MNKGSNSGAWLILPVLTADVDCGPFTSFLHIFKGLFSGALVSFPTLGRRHDGDPVNESRGWTRNTACIPVVLVCFHTYTI